MKSLKPVVAAMIVLGACAQLASAQLSSISPSTIESPAINASQRSQIDAYVGAALDDAIGDDPLDAYEAWDELVEPLTGDYVSPEFRRAYGEALEPVFRVLDAKNDVKATLATLRLSGELGTQDAIRRISESLSSDDPGVRIFAAGRAGRVLASTARNGAAVEPSELQRMADQVGTLAGETTNAELRGACVRALGAGAALPSRDYRTLRGVCIGHMCRVSSHALRDASESDLSDAASLAVQSAASATAALSAVGEDATQDATKGAVELSAQMLAKVLKRVVNSQIGPVGARELDTTLVRAGESLLYFALREHAEITGGSVGSVRQTTLSPDLETGEDRDFRNAAALLIGPGSPVVTEFGFADDEFVN